MPKHHINEFRIKIPPQHVSVQWMRWFYARCNSLLAFQHRKSSKFFTSHPASCRFGKTITDVGHWGRFWNFKPAEYWKLSANSCVASFNDLLIAFSARNTNQPIGTKACPVGPWDISVPTMRLLLSWSFGLSLSACQYFWYYAPNLKFIVLHCTHFSWKLRWHPGDLLYDWWFQDVPLRVTESWN